ncbi:MAG: hypothetical protein ABI304_02715 [Rudaea sp.]
MKRTIVCILLAMGLVTAAQALSLKVANNSKTGIQHLYLSDAGDKNWGPDQLGDGKDDTIEPGGSYTITRIEAGDYDVKLVADDDTECEVDDVDFKTSKTWTITEHMLDKCDK